MVPAFHSLKFYEEYFYMYGVNNSHVSCDKLFKPTMDPIFQNSIF